MRQAARALAVQDDRILLMKRYKKGALYYTLIGGGIEQDETPEEALKREVTEETGMTIVDTPRLVFTHDQPEPWGMQYVFLCHVSAGQPALPIDSIEAHISVPGENTFEPLWLPLIELPSITLRSEELKMAIIEGLKSGFPAAPKQV